MAVALAVPADSVEAVSLVSSVEVPAEVEVPWDLLSWAVGTRCWTMVLLTANLKAGGALVLSDDSEMTAFRMLFCSARACQKSTERVDSEGATNDNGVVPLGCFVVLVELGAAKSAIASLCFQCQLP